MTANDTPVRLIVTGDDLGFDAMHNRAIVRSLIERWITHASLVVNMAGFEEACELVHEHGLTDRIGVHLNFTDGVPLADAMRRSARFCVDGHFAGGLSPIRYLPLSSAEKRVVAEEILAQIGAARRRGLPLTHADSHHHAHTWPGLSSAVRNIVKAAGIRRVRPLRNCGRRRGFVRPMRNAVYNSVLKVHGLRAVRYFGDLEDILWLAGRRPLSPSFSAEAMVHPTYDANGAILDESSGEALTDQLVKLRRYVGDSIDAEGRITLDIAVEKTSA